MTSTDVPSQAQILNGILGYAGVVVKLLSQSVNLIVTGEVAPVYSKVQHTQVEHGGVVDVNVGVLVAVNVGVFVAVKVGVCVGVGSDDAVKVGVFVAVNVGVGVGVGVKGTIGLLQSRLSQHGDDEQPYVNE